MKLRKLQPIVGSQPDPGSSKTSAQKYFQELQPTSNAPRSIPDFKANELETRIANSRDLLPQNPIRPREQLPSVNQPEQNYLSSSLVAPNQYYAAQQQLRTQAPERNQEPRQTPQRVDTYVAPKTNYDLAPREATLPRATKSQQNTPIYYQPPTQEPLVQAQLPSNQQYLQDYYTYNRQGNNQPPSK